MPQPDVTIIGAGLSGLSCAHTLQKNGVPFTILEASDRVGGRLRTDFHEGFTLDHGFQTLLTSYPEAKKILDYEALNLRKFSPGAKVWCKGKLPHLSDPWRDPLHFWSTLTFPHATFRDKILIAILRRKLKRSATNILSNMKTQSTHDFLIANGFSKQFIHRFFRPFFGGVFLNSSLENPAEQFSFLFQMFSDGHAVIPSEGMQAIPKQIAENLPQDSIQLNTPVESISKNKVILETGEILNSQAIVVATEAPAARRFFDHFRPLRSRSAHCLYFKAPESPLSENILILNGEGKGPINNLCVLSDVCASYAPPDASLISVTVLENWNGNINRLEENVMDQLKVIFGIKTQTWRHLKTYSIAHALPYSENGSPSLPSTSVPNEDSIFACGDYFGYPSINNAFRSGRLAAEAIMGQNQKRGVL